MNNRDSQRNFLFCPLEEEVVDTLVVCGHCEFWDGQICSLLDGHLAKKRKKRSFRSCLKSVFRRRRFSGRRGRGLRVPVVWEKWPSAKPETDESLPESDVVDYGTPELPQDVSMDMVDHGSEETIPPEMVKEYWDVEQDVPDWLPGSEQYTTTEPGVSDELMPEDNRPEPFQTDFGSGPATEGPQGPAPDLPPDVPPDFFGPAPP